VDFIPYNPWEPVEVQEGNLPHWQQDRRTYFITWRTDDSIPAASLRQWNQARDIWLHVHGVTADNVSTLPPEKQIEYHDRFTKSFHTELDRGHGACLLRTQSLRDIVEQTLRHFDGVRYDLGDFVLVPNHVHFLVCLNDDVTITGQCFSWKRFSSGEINKASNRRGTFWQSESYDHIVRSLEALRRIQNYIASNPSHARLREGEFTLYQLESWR
jgi:type I restriction enzyme R subunit